MTPNELLEEIYELRQRYNFDEIGELIDSYFKDWKNFSDLNSFSTFFYALELDKINKKIAVMILSTAHPYSDKLPLFVDLVDRCMDEFGDKSTFGKFRRPYVAPGPMAGW